jgi:thiosulfate/3-mercaptopyruvate sulfurtransferase
MIPRTLACLIGLSAAAFPATRAEMLVSTDWLAQRLNDPNVVVLHVARDRAVYDKGHIPGARFLPYNELLISEGGVSNELPAVEKLEAVFERAGVSDDSRVILYADDQVLPATRCYFTLDYLGHGDRAALLDGGIQKWRAEERPVSTDAVTPATGGSTPRPRPEVVAKLQEVKGISAGGNAAKSTLVDARPQADFAGANPPGGHIPGAVNVTWGFAQLSQQNSALKPEAELRKLYEDAGVKPGQPAVAYCNSGVQASHTYFTLRYLGYDVKLFDGSLN